MSCVGAAGGFRSELLKAAWGQRVVSFLNMFSFAAAVLPVVRVTFTVTAFTVTIKAPFTVLSFVLKCSSALILVSVLCVSLISLFLSLFLLVSSLRRLSLLISSLSIVYKDTALCFSLSHSSHRHCLVT